MVVEFTREHEDKLNRVNELVRGNGDVGLRSETKQNTKDLKIIKSDIRKGVWLILATLVANIISIYMNSGFN